MSAPPTAEWYLDVGGNQAGPYSTDQILELARSGKLLPHHRVTAAHLANQWITVEQLAQGKAGSAEGGAHFQPPPKPLTLEKQTSYSPTGDQITDPMLGLFDALQAARERKAPKPSVAAAAPHAPVLRESMFDGIPNAVWMGAGGVLVLGLIVWGFLGVMKQQGAGLNKFEAMISPDNAPVKTAPANPVARATRPINSATRSTAAVTRTAAPAAIRAPSRPSFGSASAPASRRNPGGYPFGRVGQPVARPLNAPLMRTPANSGAHPNGSASNQNVDPRDLERERERQKEEQELERERHMYDGGRDPDSVGGGLAPAPDSVAPPAPTIPKDGPAPSDSNSDDRGDPGAGMDINSSRID